MSSSAKIKKTNISKFQKILAGVVSFVSVSLFLMTLSINSNLDYIDKLAQAAAPNTGKLIIGTTETANSIEISVCLQATDGPIHITNASTWLQFDTTALTPTSGSFIEKGKYNGTDGYGQLKWNEVSGALSGNINKYTMNLAFSGDGVSAGQSGLIMSVNSPELFGKVSFAKTVGSTSSTSITLVKNIFYSTESLTAAIQQTVTNIIGDCRSSGLSSSSSSLSISSINSSSSSLTNSTNLSSSSRSSISNSSSTSSVVSSANNQSGGGVIFICAGPCPQNSITTNNSSNSQIISSQSNSTTTNKQSGIFKSKLKITDPYVCGEGAYGNVLNPKENGVDFVYYEFYREGSTISSYNYKLKMNDNGDFYLPISKSTNVIADGNYKVVFYAYDKEGNKAQGEYTALIASDCNNAKINGISSPTVRTGGLQIIQSILLIIASVALLRFYKLSKTEKITLKM